MKRRIPLLAIALAALFPAPRALARGGGGCLGEGAPVLTPAGPVPIERLAPGDGVIAVVDGRPRPASVVAVVRGAAPVLLELRFPGGALCVTPEHPVGTGPGVFRAAAALRAGDGIRVLAGGSPREVRLDAVRAVPADRPVYNLLVSPGGTFVAAGVVLHNKGCFLPDTPILKADGTEAPIRDVKPGDELAAFTPEGALVRARVLSVIAQEVDAYAVVVTTTRALRVTSDHPFYVGGKEFRTLEALRPGSAVYVCDARGLRPEPILRIDRVEARARVYNLQTDAPHTFFAAGVAVHNKGGGCFPAGTPVRTPDGERPIERLAPGDAVLAPAPDGTIVRATVRAVLAREADGLVELATARRTLRATPDHPVAVAGGAFRAAGALAPGGELRVAGRTGLESEPILRVTGVSGPVRVFNLSVGPPHTFFAAGVAAHNKGGGCFPAGTPVLTPDGERPIESLVPGQAVVALDEDGRPAEARVREIHAALSPLWTIETEAGAVQATADHPFALAAGGFREAAAVGPGEAILWWGAGPPRPARVRSVRAEGSEAAVYNLTVDGPHTFVASGFVVHNKGFGCFPEGTPVRTPGGERPIETLVPGDAVLAVDGRGRVRPARVRARVPAFAPLWAIETDAGAVRATPDHPFRLAGGGYRDAADLDAGDAILVWREGGLRAGRVRGTRADAPAAVVYNLQVDAPHTFIAAGCVVHNKGGGRGGGGSGTADPAVLVFFGTVLVIVIIVSKGRAREDLDYVFSRRKVSPKGEQTRKLLEFIARVDAAWSPDALAQTARDTFLLLQRCWEERQYGPMQPRLMPDLYKRHCRQIEAMVRNHEINRIADLRIERIDIVHVRYTQKDERRTFTALVTAWSRDHYVDDRTGERLRGDTSSAQFQEFWTFQRHGGAWRLRDIEQTRESDALRDENLFEPFTDPAVRQIAGDASGPAGPWAEEPVVAKDSRIDRALAFLVQTDRLWDRDAMVRRAEDVFVRVFLAREAGDPAGAPAADLFPDAGAALAEDLRRMRAAGTSAEFRNLCVRKVDLVLVRNFADNRQDEFTARISAHAQRILRRGGAVVRQDEDVTAFVEYWTFGRLDGAWKLKAVEPPARGASKVAAENLDEDSSPEQLRWYYTQPRAT